MNRYDLVYRDQVVNTLKKHMPYAIFDDDGNYTTRGMRLLDVISTVPAAQAQQWIPCSERLPEIGRGYIVTGKQKYAHEKEWTYFVDVAFNYGNYIDDYWDTFIDWDEGQETHIIAWMPLPEPYGGENE